MKMVVYGGKDSRLLALWEIRLKVVNTESRTESKSELCGYTEESIGTNSFNI